MEEHKDFLNWYKTKVTQNLEEPPPQVWEKIADELDTNDVWTRIAADLDTRSGWFPQRVLYASLALVLLLFMAGGSYYYFRNNDGDSSQTVSLRTDTKHRTNATEQNEQTSRDKNKSERDVNHAGSSNENDADHNRTRSSGEIEQRNSGRINRRQATVITQAQSLFHSTERSGIIAVGDAGTDRVSLSRVVLPDSMLTVAVGRTALPGILRKLPILPDDDSQTFRKSFLFGITASAKNTWLLNRQTLSGLEKKTLHNTRLDFGKDLGVVIAYDFSPLFALQAEGNFLSDMGQRYEEYRNGKYVEREIDLTYYNANLMLKYSPHKYSHGFAGSAHAITGGFFYSLLKNSFENIDGRPAVASDDYVSDDYGAIIGYEYNRYLGERFEFTTGLRMNLGFRDIGTDPWFRTTSGSFGLNVAIKYRLLLD